MFYMTATYTHKSKFIMKKLILFAVIFQFVLFNLNAQNIGINATGAAPDAGAMLDISSIDKGLLIPRVNIANLATIAPIVGSTTVSMLVYNTNATTGLGYHYWNGAAWVRLSTDGTDWQITGNANTTFGTHFLGTTNAQGLDFRTNNIIRLRIPNANQIHANSNGTTALPFYSWANDPNTGMSSLAADQLNWSTGGAERLRLTNTQLATTFNGSATVPAYSWTADPNMGMYRIGADILGFSTNGVERMRIIANGQSAINGVPGAGDVLSVYGTNATLAWSVNGYNTGTGGGSGFFLNSNASNGFNTLEVINTSSSNFNGWFWRNNNTNTIPAMRATTDAGNNRWGIYSDDEVLALNYFVISDERLKKNIQNVSSVLDNIKLLRPVQYEFNNLEYTSFGTEDVLQFGFLAAELAKIFPNTVAENSVYDPNELPNKSKQSMEGITPKFSSVNYIALVPILTKGIQEQQTIIEAQNERIDALEQLILELQKAIENK